ncbi:hypothetical protein FRC08_014841, partial [Ceratobasidium sp. 394]
MGFCRRDSQPKREFLIFHLRDKTETSRKSVVVLNRALQPGRITRPIIKDIPLDLATEGNTSCSIAKGDTPDSTVAGVAQGDKTDNDPGQSSPNPGP